MVSSLPIYQPTYSRVSIFGAINGTHYEGGNGSVKMHSSSAFTNIDLATDNSNNNDPLSD